MPYCHSQKIGNQGDLIKHFALTLAVQKFPRAEHPFSYLEVHAGFADYVLQDDGEWLDGIGRFARLYSRAGQYDEALDYYFNLHALGNIQTRRRYSGSSKIVLGVLHDRYIVPVMHLCDTAPAVGTALSQAYAGEPDVHIYCEDGYAKAKQLSPVDLVFIDPPDMQRQFQTYIDLIEHCLQHRQAFIAWNSLHGNHLSNGMSARCRRVLELARSHAVARISVKWAPQWAENMCGCQMLLALPGGGSVAQACRALVKLMDWDMID